MFIIIVTYPAIPLLLSFEFVLNLNADLVVNASVSEIYFKVKLYVTMCDRVGIITMKRDQIDNRFVCTMEL